MIYRVLFNKDFKVGFYSENFPISDNFMLSEFACKDGSKTIIINPLLIEKIQKVREITGRPIVVTSAYRNPVHNKNVGGNPKSLHMEGLALDVIPNIDKDKFADICKSVGFTGIGVYGTFVHLDLGFNKTW